MIARVCLLAAAQLLLHFADLSAQQRADSARVAAGRIIGAVTDAATGEPIGGVVVRLNGLDAFNRITDSRGAFVFTDVPRGVHELVIEHLGYGTGTHLVNVPGGETITFDAALEQHAIALDSLIITANVRSTQLARVGFHARAKNAVGRFFSNGAVSTLTLREVLYSIPRVEIAHTGSIRHVIFRMPRGPCAPDIFLDGVRQTWADGRIEEVVGGIEIEAMEVYVGLNTPAEFVYNPRFAPCGAIVIWSRR